MASISLNTFRMGRKHDVQEAKTIKLADGGLLILPRRQDYTFRDTSAKCRLREWTATHNLTLDRWVFVKTWTTQLPGEPHYIRTPNKIAIALKMAIDRDFPSP